MAQAERKKALDQLELLHNSRSTVTLCESVTAKSPRAINETYLTDLLAQAELTYSPACIIFCSLACGLAFAAAFSRLLSIYFLPVYFLAGAYIPFGWLERRVRARAAKFVEDYPAVLLATASSIKVGYTPQVALERATRLLSKQSLVRKEVEILLHALRRGVPKQEALANFARTIRAPELELFRSAFLLVLENGGRFAPTLGRLSQVSSDRAILIRTAEVTTATMRMTANVLLVIAPVVISMMAIRTDNYFETLFNNPTANLIGTIGLVLISGGYLVLRQMSNFKP